jgi:hypothetical protein
MLLEHLGKQETFGIILYNKGITAEINLGLPDLNASTSPKRQYRQAAPRPASLRTRKEARTKRSATPTPAGIAIIKEHAANRSAGAELPAACPDRSFVLSSAAHFGRSHETSSSATLCARADSRAADSNPHPHPADGAAADLFPAHGPPMRRYRNLTLVRKPPARQRRCLTLMYGLQVVCQGRIDLSP